MLVCLKAVALELLLADGGLACQESLMLVCLQAWALELLVEQVFFPEG